MHLTLLQNGPPRVAAVIPHGAPLIERPLERTESESAGVLEVPGVLVLGVLTPWILVLGVPVLGVLALGILIPGVLVLEVLTLGILVLGVRVLGVLVTELRSQFGLHNLIGVKRWS